MRQELHCGLCPTNVLIGEARDQDPLNDGGRLAKQHGWKVVLQDGRPTFVCPECASRAVAAAGAAVGPPKAPPEPARVRVNPPKPTSRAARAIADKAAARHPKALPAAKPKAGGKRKR